MQINTDTRVGRQLDALIQSSNKRGKVIVTVDLASASQRYHQTFVISTWQGRDGTPMLSVDVKGAWPRVKVLHMNLLTQRVGVARQSESDALLVYAARTALGFAITSETPAPSNGTVNCHEEAVCGHCGADLTDPVSIERGIGPTCAGKGTGTKTIIGRRPRQEAIA